MTEETPRPESDEKRLARAIYNTFRTADGKAVLSWLMNEAGFFETVPARMVPENIALINRLLVAGHMTVTGDMGRYALAVVESYDLSDLVY